MASDAPKSLSEQPSKLALPPILSEPPMPITAPPCCVQRACSESVSDCALWPDVTPAQFSGTRSAPRVISAAGEPAGMQATGTDCEFNSLMSRSEEHTSEL